MRGYDYLEPELYDVYISGFPRSGNHFVTGAIKSLSNEKLKINPVNHLPPFSRLALKKKIPSVVLIRNPVDSCVSWSIYDNCSLGHSLRFYCQYHRIMSSVLAESCVLKFEDFSSELKPAIVTLNQMFSLDLSESFSDEEIHEKVFEETPKWVSSKSPRPSIERNAQAKKLKEEIRFQPRYVDTLAKAQEIYSNLCVVADSQRRDS